MAQGLPLKWTGAAKNVEGIKLLEDIPSEFDLLTPGFDEEYSSTKSNQTPVANGLKLNVCKALPLPEGEFKTTIPAIAILIDSEAMSALECVKMEGRVDPRIKSPANFIAKEFAVCC